MASSPTSPPTGSPWLAAAIGVGHLLVQQQHFRLLHDFGEALEKG